MNHSFRSHGGASVSLAAVLSFVLCLLPSICSGYGNLQFYDAHTNIVNSLWDERQYNSATFPNGIPWLLNTNGLASSTLSSVTPSQLQGIVSNSFVTWQTVPQTKIRFIYSGITTNDPSGTYTNSLPPSPALDGDNVVTFGSLPAGVLAQTCLFVLNDQYTFTSTNNCFDSTCPDIPEGTYPAGTILDSDIIAASDANWSVTGERRKYDLQGVLVHEIGHFIGLSHSCVRETYHSTATMFPFGALDPEGLEQRTLSLDDSAGVSFYYPSAAFSNDFGAIAGTVTKGGSPFFGAHVWAVKTNDRSVMVGACTTSNGTYCVQGLPSGEYVLRVEPLPVDRFTRINEVISSIGGGIGVADFQAEFYGGVAIESSSPSVTVMAGSVTSGLDFALIDGSTLDPFEPDNTFDQAHCIPIEQREIHHLYPVGDTDFLRFSATNGVTYRISTSNITLEQRTCLSCGTASYLWNSDTIMMLYDSDRATVLGRNDNLSLSNSRLESYILFVCKKTADYYLRINCANTIRHDFNSGAGSNYDLIVEPVSPAQYHVSAAGGSDTTGNGSQLAPWASVQHAIDSVQGTWEIPVFINVAEGTYFENIICQDFVSLLGGFDASTWTRDALTNVTILDGKSTGSVLNLADDLKVEGFTIRNGQATQGGGCYAARVNGNLIGNCFTNNVSTAIISGGGAICVFDVGECFIANNLFVENSSQGGGAIAYSDAAPYICYNEFRNNVATNTGALGGGISIYHPNLYISGSVIGNLFVGNRAQQGAGVYIYYAYTDVVAGNHFAENAASYGGALFVQNRYSLPLISSNVFAGNNAGEGGAIYANEARPTYAANIFVGNVSTNSGGAIDIAFASGATASVYNNVFVGNRSVLGGAIYWNVKSYDGVVICNTFFENLAETNGGGIWINDVELGRHAVFNGNIFSANLGGAVYEGSTTCDPELRNNDFHDNLPAAYYDNDTTNWYNTASVINSSVVNPGETIAANVDWSPRFQPAPSGTLGSISCNSSTRQSVLVDSLASFVPGALVGLTINPNTNQHLHFYIITNTTTTITTWGDVTAVATSPCPYRVFDWHLAGDSQLISAGANVSDVTSDIDGEPRPIGGAFDIGADEFLDSDTDMLADNSERRYALNLNSPDSDGDGMADGWEFFYRNPWTAQDGNIDSDGDGMTDLQESIAFTDPDDSGSLFRVLSMAYQTNNTANLIWTSIPNKHYAVFATTNLTLGAYFPISTTNTAAGLTATFTDLAATNAMKFYKIQVLP